MNKKIDLTSGNITKKLWLFAVPLMFGNVFQQLYNLADTWVIGKFIGGNALAAVGSSYTLMTFLTSIIIGLCLGNSSYISIFHGRGDIEKIKNGIFMSFIMIGSVSSFIVALFYLLSNEIIMLLNTPDEIFNETKDYLTYIFIGFIAVFLYNYISNIMRAVGNSFIPLLFLISSVILNIILDLYFVISLDAGVKGAATATSISQYAAAIGISIYYFKMFPEYRIKKVDIKWNVDNLKNILSLSGFTCLQQSVMNFGILLVQGLVNSFGADVMAAFAVAVKIDTIAYMPVQDFGNAFSVFVAQNFGAGKFSRIRSGIKRSLVSVTIFCLSISSIIFIFANKLMGIFVDGNDLNIINIGTRYLRIEGAFYIGIGILFMLYGYFRAINKPLVSVILTVISLGTRVFLAYALSLISSVGILGIWCSIPIGWFLADIAGVIFYLKCNKNAYKI